MVKAKIKNALYCRVELIYQIKNILEGERIEL